MSLREIWIALRQIDVRTYNEFAAQANLWGAKLPIKNPYETHEITQVSPDKKAAMERQKEEFFERKRRAING